MSLKTTSVIAQLLNEVKGEIIIVIGSPPLSFSSGVILHSLSTRDVCPPISSRNRVTIHPQYLLLKSSLTIADETSNACKT